MNSLKYGLVSSVKSGFVRVKFEEDDGIVSDWLPVMVRKSKSEKESWQLEINEHVVCIMDEHGEFGVCLGAIPNDEDTPDPGEGAGKFRKIFSDGTEIEYDSNTKKLTVDVKGELTGKATIKATVEAPLIELTGNVVISGTVTAAGLVIAAGGTMGMQDGSPLKATGDIETTGDVKAGLISLSTHKHTAPSGGGPTSTPIP
jgi:phage baseplate assembly protein V